MTPPEGGPTRRYLAGSTDLAAVHLPGKLEFAGDENGNYAMNARISHQFGPFKATLSGTYNNGFESHWTGSGQNRVTLMEDAKLSWSVAPVIMGVGLRHSLKLSGEDVSELRSFQMTAVGSAWLIHSTTTELDGSQPGATSGSIDLTGSVASIGFTAGLDYGDHYSLKPTTLRLDLDKTIGDEWSLYLSASHSIGSNYSRTDFGATRTFDSFIVSGGVGAASDGSGYLSLRLRLPLEPAPSDMPWLGY